MPLKAARLLPLVGFIVFIVLFDTWHWRLAPQASTTQSPTLRVDFFAIGQGDSILLTTPNNRRILIDGGPDSTVLTRLGQSLPFFERNIDLVVASHNHSDHIAGLNSVIERYDVGQLWIGGAIHTTNEYIDLLQNIKRHGVPTEVVWRGKKEVIDGVELEVVHPLASMESQRPDDQHNATIVIRATYGTTHFLFTGDIDEDHEKAMVNAGVPLQADVLKVPHHGSASGLLPEFLTAVAPKEAVIQVGESNRFGHPTASILKKLAERSIRVWRNDQHGTIHAVSDGTNVTVSSEINSVDNE